MRDFDAFIALLESRARTPFAWGHDKHDCFSFAGAAVEALTGDNPIRRCGHRWSTEAGALRVLDRLGGVAAAVDRVLPRLDAPSFAQRGDVGMIDLGGRQLLCVFEGHVLVAADLSGLARVPRRVATVAWSAEP
jgi:hypothetical protein